jgi:predicted nucleotidyltransferase
MASNLIPNGFEIETESENITNPIQNNVTIPDGWEIETSNNFLQEEKTPTFQGSITATPEYTYLDKLGQLLHRIKNLSYGSLKNVKHSWQQGTTNTRIGELNFKELQGNLNDLERSELAELENRIPFNYGIPENSGLINDSALDTNISNFPQRLKNSLAFNTYAGIESFPLSLDILKESGIGGAIGGTVGAVGGAVVGSLNPLLGMGKGLTKGMLLGAKLGGGSGAFKKSFELEAGLAYQELKTMQDDNGEPIDTELAKQLAYGVGAVNASLELVGAFAELATIPGADKLLKVTKIEALKKIIKDKAMQNELIQKGSKALANYYATDVNKETAELLADTALKKAGRQLVKSTATESATEMLQESSNVFATEWAKQVQGNYADALFNDEGINTNTFKQELARVIQAGTAALVPALTIGGTGTTMTALNIARHKAKLNNIDPKEAEKVISEMTQDEKVDYINDNEDILEKLAEEKLKDSVVNEVADDTFKKFVNVGVDEGKAFAAAQLVKSFSKSTLKDIDYIRDFANKLTTTNQSIEQRVFGNSSDVGGVAYQSAMYKDKTSFSVKNFVENVINNPVENKKAKKTIDNYKLSIPAGVVTHSINKHGMTAEDWEDVANNIDNIFIANKSNKNNAYSQDNYKVGIKTQNGNFYALTIGLNDFDNYICTAFKSTEKGVESFVTDKGKTPSKVHTESSKNLSIVAPLSKESSNNIINYLKRNFNPKEFAKQNLQENFGQSVEDLQIGFTDDIKNILAENEIDYDEFEIEDVRLYGSYTTGKNKDTSDLDVIVQYKGSMKEDAAFNIFSDENLTITDVNGVERKVDINPINRELSGTIDEHIERMHEIDGAYFQTVNTAGAETSAEISEAKKEWLEKGTDSKYFKKWFGDSKVVDEYGKPLVVYHGTTANNIEIFEPHNASTDFDYPDAIYFSDSINIAKTYGDTYHKEPMHVYLKMENPLEIDAKGQTYNDFYDELKRELNYAVTNYDGLIVKNIRDDWAQNDGGEIATTYIVFNPEQIKSVDNRGTFDEGNANIYYQSAYHGTPHKFDNFSTEHIGSGEGAQAHGWGLYFASNKDISENYRKDLLESYNNMSSLKYKGQPVEEENLQTALYRLKKNGLEDALFYIDKKIQFYKEQYEQDKKEYSRVKGYLETKKILLDRAVKVKKMLKDVNPDDIDISNGQLYEVDIPEDDVMLNEDLPFSKQSKKVQEGLKSLTSNLDDGMSKEAILEEIERIEIKIEENENDDYIDLGRREYISECLEMALDHMKGKLALVDIENSNLKGRTIYKAISEHLESDELASKKLNEYGIKGIKYNGHQDGECYVVFDDKAVQILNTFYQSSNNSYDINRLSNDNQEMIKQNEFNLADKYDYILNQVTGEKVFIEMNDDINVEEIKPQKISSDLPFEISEKPSDNKKNIINILNFKEGKKLVNNNTNESAIVNNKTIEKSLSNTNVNNANYKDFCNILLNSENLFITSQKILSHNDTKTNSSLNIKRFANVAKIANNEYLIEFVLKDNKELRIYSIDVIEQKSSGNEKTLRENSRQHDTTINSITYIKQLFKSKLLKKYNRDYVTNLKSLNNNTHYQSNFSSPLENLHKRVKEKRTEKILGYKGYFNREAEKNIIGIMQNADASTVIHELGHVFLDTLKELSIKSPEIAEKYEAVKRAFHITGNELTIQQHEDFAKAFEAYIYNGKAPNKTLQSVFTQLKEWLRGIYDYWLNNNDGFVLRDDIKNAFDEIFDEQPKETNKTKKIKKYLETAKNITISNDGFLTDSQARHKKVAYDIVARATGYKKEYIRMVLHSPNKMVKQHEEIYRRCNECDDKISAGGYPPEWLEFYGDASFYEEGNDYILAEQALSDIVNDAWQQTFDADDYYNEYQAQYEYLLNAYKEEVLERDEIFSAMFEWLEDLDKKDKDAAALYGEMFGRDLQYIDRIEHLSDIEKAKQEIREALIEMQSGNIKRQKEARNTIERAVNKLNYKTKENSSFTDDVMNDVANKENISDEVKAFQETVKTILKKLDFLTPTDKAKMLTNILDAPNATFLNARLDSIMDLANTMNEVNYRKSLLEEIRQEIMNSKDIKQQNKYVGRYDYRTNKIFETLRTILKMTNEEANDLRLERQQLIEAGESDGLSFEDRIINSFLQIKADGLTYANTDLIKQFYDDVISLKLAGKNAKDEQDLLNKLNHKNATESVVKILESKTKEANLLTKFYVNNVANWESMLNAFFSKKVKDKYSLIANETKSSVFSFKEKREFERKVAEIYGTQKWNYDAEILKNLSQEFTYKKNNYDKVVNDEGKTEWKLRRIVPVKLNKMELILAYMWDKNEVLHERQINMWGEEQLIDMIDQLSDQDKKLGDLMMKMINKYYPLANAVFIKKYGIDLPKVAAYFPSVAERDGSISEMDLFTDFTMKSSTPSAIKTRSGSTFVQLKYSNPVAMFYNHIDQMSRFIFLTDSIDKINKIFNTADVKDLIKNKFGDTALQTFMQQLVNVSFKQNATIRSQQMKVVSQALNSWTSGNIIGKPSTGIKQLFAALNYQTVMPVDEWNKGFIKALMNPKETIKYMYDKIEYLQYRFESGSQNEALQQFINNNFIEKWFYDRVEKFVKDDSTKKLLKMSTITAPRKIRELASLFLRLGDMGAIIFGGKPYIDYLINVKGMSEEQALREFVVETQRTQQSAEISTLNSLQIRSQNEPYLKVFMNYKNAQGQFIRKIADSIINYSRGEIDKTQLAKDVYMYGYLQGLLFKLGTSLSIITLVNTGEAKDLIDDLITSIFDNLTFFHAFGDISVGAINYLISGDMYVGTTPFFGDIAKELLKLSKEDVSIEDVIHVLGFVTQVKEGIPLNSFINEMSGLGNIANGDIQKGSLKLLGWSDKRASIATGTATKTKEKKKKRKRAKRKALTINHYIK